MPVLSDTNNELVIDHLYLVKRVIFKYIHINEGVIGLAFDDLFQEGSLLLCKAAMKFNGNTDFKRFACKVIKNGLISHCRQITGRMKIASITYLDDFLVSSHGELIYDFRDSANEYGNKETSELDTDSLLESLKNEYADKTTRLGIEAMGWIIKGYSCKDIANIYGVKSNLVGAWISRAKKKLSENNQLISKIAS